jgi:outer membrane lipoprotein SlyB
LTDYQKRQYLRQQGYSEDVISAIIGGVVGAASDSAILGSAAGALLGGSIVGAIGGAVLGDIFSGGGLFD